MQTVKLGALNTLATNLAHRVLGLFPEQYGIWGISFDINRMDERGGDEGKTYIACSIDVVMNRERIARLFFDFYFVHNVPAPYEIKITFVDIRSGEDSHAYQAFPEHYTWRLVPVI